ncbi:phage tail sheath protein FI [Pantoea agglomerans]|jgi:phage tail sheath protein FI|uniref:phage tail sheath family protein n=1 Tax=Enterobacter agglomerans TaxID=549 RepID=UPI0013B98F10|nr:phage tail sheath subtilisin-like domain-containing protein [Pantoea agglomerans]MDQ0430967.1 phage tail sheath protein FI [Pantoea agglomerans]NEG84927.1 phage tail sheath family protein [Pantoea agglomerans]NEH06700.1 phage tail sheath family protein [Pantoea agglomerans]
MPTVTTVPGVYIEEDASPAMSVSAGATAVPLFVARFSPFKPELEGVITRIGSWLDYTTLFDSNMPSSVTVNVTSTEGTSAAAKKGLKKASSGTSEATTPNNYQIEDIEVVDHSASVSLKLYFQNGGGPCYLYPLANKADEAKLDALPGQIDEVGQITLLACPDPDEEYRTAVYGALAGSLGEHKGYFLLADSAEGDAPDTVTDSAHVAVYYPNVMISYTRMLDDEHITIVGYNGVTDETGVTLATLRNTNSVFADEIDKALADKRSTTLSLTPSALIAGVYNKTDGERGVWKAPANVVLNGVSDVSVRVTNEQQAFLNPKGINVIRYFSGRGLVVWGSRTQKNDDDWRYIPVRRLFDAAERDIKKALLPMVFEPNSQPTWKRVQAAIDNYLYLIWQQGALAGNKAEEAYFVRVGKSITMTQDDINQGKMIIQVGMAAVRPAEFIILKFTQDMSQ